MSQSLIHRARVRRGILAAGLLGTLVSLTGVSPAAAAPVSLTLDYTCNFPLLKPQPLKLKINSDIPTSIPKSSATGAFPISATADVSAQSARGLSGIGATTLSGTALAGAVLELAGGFELDLAVPTVIDPTAIPASGGFTTQATGSTPSISLPTVGDTKVRVKDLVLTLTPRLADGLPTGLEEFETECFQNPGQNNVLATIAVTNGTPTNTAPTQPGAPVITDVATTSAKVSWAPSTDDKAVTGYTVKVGSKTIEVGGDVTSTTVSGLTAGTAYPVSVSAKDAEGLVSLASATTNFTTKSTASCVAYGYNLAGAAVLKNLTRGTLPLSGGIDACLTLADGSFVGDLGLNPTAANLTALGFLPVRASVRFDQIGQTTGTLKDGLLTSNSKVRIKLPSVTLFGLQLAGGSACQTRSASAITLRSATGQFFDPLEGGRLTGTFSISDLTGCGFLTGIVSPLTSGSGNTIAVNLTPKTTA